MAQICRVCASDRKMDIEEALLQGQTLRNIGIKFGVPYGSVHTHKMDHMAADMLQAYKVQRRLTEVMDVPDKMYAEWQTLETLMDHLLAPLANSKEHPEDKIITLDRQLLAVVLRLRHKYFVTMLQVLGEMPEQTVINVMATSQMAQMLRKMDAALGDDEELRARLAQALHPSPRLINGSQNGSQNGNGNGNGYHPEPFKRDEDEEDNDGERPGPNGAGLG